MNLLRSALFNAWFFGITFVLGLGGVAVRWLAPHRALDYAKFWVRMVLGGARVICGIRFVVTGLENLPSGPAVIVSQHQSAFDTLVWTRLVPNVSYVFKAELARIPLFGPMLLAAGQIPLDRGASVGAVRKLLKAVDRAKAEGRQIVIFPEGTRVPVGQDVALRGGFAMIGTRTGLPMVPVRQFWPLLGSPGLPQASGLCSYTCWRGHSLGPSARGPDPHGEAALARGLACGQPCG